MTTERHIYDVGYSTEEDSLYRQWVKEGPALSDEQLLGHICECLLVALRDPDEWWNQDPGRDSNPWLMYLFGSPAFGEAMRSRGFEPLEFTARVSAYGWAEALTPGHRGAKGTNDKIQRWLRDRTEATP